MAALVTLDRVKQALRIDFDDDDEILALYIDAASAAVVAYLKDQAEDLIPEDAEADDLPPAIQMATIILVGQFYKDPDGNADNAFMPGYLPAPVTALLYPLRDPALK